MAANADFLSVLVVAVLGVPLSVIIEWFMIPRPGLRRPWRAWGIHIGLWLLLYGLLALVLGRPWFAAAGVSAFLLMLVLVNNAKVKVLREPFVFQDYEYFTDAIRHPRLFIPFLGWGKFLGAAAGFLLAVAVGLWGESVPGQRFAWSGQFGGIAVVFGTGILLLVVSAKRLLVSFVPDRDIQTRGLLASLWCYGKERRNFPKVKSPFEMLRPKDSTKELPHLVAVQSESFFDPRPLYAGIRTTVLANFDQLRTESFAHGKLKVPAWGANTVRTEFAFLSGIDDNTLGMHRFNPYRAITAGWDVSSLAAFLKRLGYRTVCIHPYPASFYQRDSVLPKLCFDEFIDIRAFATAKKNGPYVGDAMVGDKIASVLDEASSPVFVFAITMENHGPLHLEQVEPSDIDEFYTMPPPPDCEDLTIYLRHLQNGDRMAGALRKTLERCDRPASLCWFGDHVPIMPSVYNTFGTPPGEVEYLLWSNRNDRTLPENRDLPACDLSVDWLRVVDVV